MFQASTSELGTVINQQAVQQNSQNAIAQQNQWFNNFQAQQKQKSDAFDSYMKSVQDQQTVRDRSNADFDEVIRGYRDVEDTGTGDKTAVDLGNVDGVVLCDGSANCAVRQ